MTIWRQSLLGIGALVLAACGSGTGATGVDDALSDAGDAQIAPQDTVADVAPDVTLDVQPADVPTDVVVPKDIVVDTWIDSDVPPPPDIVAPDAQPDTAQDVVDPVDAQVDVGDTFVAQNCAGFGGSGTCPPGLACWNQPCPKCGVMAQGFCLPQLQSGGCYDYTACNGGACVKANPMSGVAGWCLAANKNPGECWPEASELTPDCYPGATCEGAFICPPMGACPMADKPGKCTPAAEQKGNVYLWERNGGIVSPGETVHVTWINNTGASIFLAGCATYNIQNSSDGSKWTDLGPNVMCVWEGVAVEVPAGAYYDTMDWLAPTTFTPGALNYRFHGSYSTGCKPGQALSQAGCTASTDIDSQTFFVGAVP